MKNDFASEIVRKNEKSTVGGFFILPTRSNPHLCGDLSGFCEPIHHLNQKSTAIGDAFLVQGQEDSNPRPTVLEQICKDFSALDFFSICKDFLR